MPDSPTTPDPKTSPPQADELAKDLPGLPVELDDYCVAEPGFYLKPGAIRAEGTIPWRQVTGIKDSFWGGTELEALASDSCDVRRVRISATPKQVNALVGTWREYVTRVVARDGALKGDHRIKLSDMQFWPRALLMAALVTAAILLLVCGQNIANVGFTLASRALAAFYVSLATAVAIAGITTRRYIRATLLDWYRWELRRDGLSFWPSGEERRLTLSSGDVAGPDCASVAEVRVPVSYLTYAEVLSPLLMAMVEREGGLTRNQGNAIMVGLGVLVLVLTAGVLGYQALMPVSSSMSYNYAIASIGVATVIAITAFLWGRARSRARRRRLLAEGRAMLERLGW